MLSHQNEMPLGAKKNQENISPMLFFQ